VMYQNFLPVMAGLDPAIHVFLPALQRC